MENKIVYVVVSESQPETLCTYANLLHPWNGFRQLFCFT